ncbi:hypothetical protein F5H01DRAFT_353721 [Linnemannia elongata]|nr:hypothetical protein F5H01DRAFT_353721 [Linnemannia elongata]
MLLYGANALLGKSCGLILVHALGWLYSILLRCLAHLPAYGEQHPLSPFCPRVWMGERACVCALICEKCISFELNNCLEHSNCFLY